MKEERKIKGKESKSSGLGLNWKFREKKKR